MSAFDRAFAKMMSDVVDGLNPDNLRTVDGVCTPLREIKEEVLRLAIYEINMLRSNNAMLSDAYKYMEKDMYDQLQDERQRLGEANDEIVRLKIELEKQAYELRR